MRTETEEIRRNLKYLSLLARDYPSQAAAASEIISTQALLKLPKGTEHFMSDLHGENEAFVHILNSASGVIREKVDQVLGDQVPAAERAELATPDLLPRRKAAPAQGQAARRGRAGRLVQPDAVPADRHLPAGVLQAYPQLCPLLPAFGVRLCAGRAAPRPL